MIGTVEYVQGLYRLMLPSTESVVINTISLNTKSVFSCNKVPIDLCHFRLGHPSHDRFHLLKQCYPILSNEKQFVCDTCHKSKQIKLSFPHSDSHVVTPFSLIHIDIWGPCATLSFNGHKCFLTIVDDHTHFAWIFPTISKAET